MNLLKPSPLKVSVVMFLGDCIYTNFGRLSLNFTHERVSEVEKMGEKMESHLRDIGSKTIIVRHSCIVLSIILKILIYRETWASILIPTEKL
jgi:hypothetical protein